MKSRIAISVPALAVFALVATTTLSFAQAIPARELPASASPSDQEWQSLRSLGRPRAHGLSSKDPAASIKARERVVADLLADADTLKAFRSRDPGHPQSREAKQREALALLHASAAGDVTQTQRRKELVAQVRADRSLSSLARSEVAAFADNLEVQQRVGLNREARLRAFEETVRRLIVEFPDVPTGYESLLRIASAQSEASALRVARELKDVAAAPDPVRQEARIIIVRSELVGKQLREILAGLAVRKALPPDLSRPIVLYSWATWSESSMNRARKLGASAPANAWLIGINLDLDEGVARTVAKDTALPGEQLYDGARHEVTFAQALALSSPGLVFITDETGHITSTSAQRDVDAALAAIAKP